MKNGLRTIKTWRDFNSESKTSQLRLIAYQDQSYKADRVYSMFKKVSVAVGLVILTQLVIVPSLLPSSAADSELNKILRDAMHVMSLFIVAVYVVLGMVCLFLLNRKRKAKRWIERNLGIDVTNINLYCLTE